MNNLTSRWIGAYYLSEEQLKATQEYFKRKIVMRDKSRIVRLISKLEGYWLRVPDWRFGQLIENLKEFSKKSDLYYMEDDEFEQLIDEFFTAYDIIKDNRLKIEER